MKIHYFALFLVLFAACKSKTTKPVIDIRTPGPLLQVAYQHQTQKRHSQAYQIYNQVINTYPGSHHAENAAGKLLELSATVDQEFTDLQGDMYRAKNKEQKISLIDVYLKRNLLDIYRDKAIQMRQSVIEAKAKPKKKKRRRRKRKKR